MLGYIRFLEGLCLNTWESKRKVMRRYDKTAEMYNERYSEEQIKNYRKALENVNFVGAAVLDVGCGSGLFFSQVALKAQLVLGVDVSRKLLLKATLQAKDFGNICVVQADCDHLPFRDGVFEAVFAFTVLQNMPKPAVTVDELKRIATVGGSVVVSGLKKVFGLDEFMNVLGVVACGLKHS